MSVAAEPGRGGPETAAEGASEEAPSLARLAGMLRQRLAMAAELGLEPAISPTRLAASRRELAGRSRTPSRSPSDPAAGPPGAERRAPSAEPSAPDTAAPDTAAPDTAAPDEERARRAVHLAELAREVAPCTLCPLAGGRTQTVFGVGDPCARLLFVGEAPGREEDRKGEPFVGPAGQLLDRIIGAMGLARGDVYIANVCKCRPPENRTPRPDEMAACLPFLRRQIEIIRPEIICALGSVAARGLLRTELSVGRLRGEFHEFDGIPVRVTYHPAYLLRAPHEKKKTWADIQAVMARLA